VLSGTGAIGGPRGRFATATRWAPLRILLALASLTLLLGYVEKSPCASGYWEHSLQYTHVCYSDIIPLWEAEGLQQGDVPYRDHAVEYPVVTGAFMWVSSELTHAWGVVANDQKAAHTTNLVAAFGAISCLMLAVVALLAVVGTAGAAGRRVWDTALFAASPLLIFHAFSNWDLIAMAFTSCALWAWARRRPVLCGMLIGLGTAAKLYPAFLLVPLAILAWRSMRWREPVITAGTALAAWLAVNGPAAIAWHTGWWEFYSFSAKRPAEASTFWAMLAHYWPKEFGGGGDWVPAGWIVASVFLVALVGVAWLGMSAPARPRLAQLAFLTVTAFLLTTKVWSPQYSVWLVPLLALARPRWRSALVWQATEIVVWAMTLWWLLAGTDSAKGITYESLTAALLIRDGMLLLLCALIVREMWRPALDPVRTWREPDPGAGVFADATLDRRL